MRLRTIWLTLAACVVFVVASAQKPLEIRLSPQHFDAQNQMLYIDLAVRYDGAGEVYIADQNIRLFYDSRDMKFDVAGTQTDLPGELYSTVHFHEHFSGIEARGMGKLEFDGHMGFVNLSVDLMDNLNGGIRIGRADGWVNLMTLTFRVGDTEMAYQVVCSHPSKTEEYASAFVEITEWCGSNCTKPFSIVVVEDLSIIPERHDDENSLQLAPNPATEYLKIGFGDYSEAAGSLVIKDGQGRTVIKQQKKKNHSEITLSLKGLSSARYTLEYYDIYKMPIYQESFVVAN